MNQFSNKKEAGKGPETESDKLLAEAKAMFKEFRGVETELEKTLDEYCELAGKSPKQIREELENLKQTAPAKWETIQSRKNALLDPLKKIEIPGKAAKQAKTEGKRPKKGRSKFRGINPNWIPVK